MSAPMADSSARRLVATHRSAPPRAPARSLVLSSTVALVVLGISPAPGFAKPYCPSYEKGKGDGKHKCGVRAFPGSDPTFDEWQAIFAVVALGPARWGDRGPPIPDLKSGCGAGRQRNVPAAFPCEILKALAVKESNWHQFCEPTAPKSQRGKSSQTLISFDCGFGVSQVTSGMRDGETSKLDRERVASDALYNLAAGASILASKWQSSRCIDTRDPTVLEHWYVALWKYNGYSYSNDPSNPIFSSTRGIWDPKIGGDAPYQEKVFGIVEKGSKKGKLWKPIALAYPRIEDIGGRSSAPIAKIECASPTDCTHRRPTHRSQCDLTIAETLLATPAASTGGSGGGLSDAGAGTTSGGADSSPVPPGNGSPGCSCGVAVTTGVSLLVSSLAILALLWAARRRALRRPP